MKQQQMKNGNYGKEKRSTSKASSKNSGSNGSPNVNSWINIEKVREKIQVLNPTLIFVEQS